MHKPTILGDQFMEPSIDRCSANPSPEAVRNPGEAEDELSTLQAGDDEKRSAVGS